MRTPTPSTRYAVVIAGLYGPDVSFWDSSEYVIQLLAWYASKGCCAQTGVAVWHRRSAKARWVCITN